MKSPMDKCDFIRGFGIALANGVPYAAGKIGFSEQHWLYYPMFLAQHPSAVQARAYEVALTHHCLRQSGVFPSDRESILAFNDFYVKHLRNLDCLGLFGSSMEQPILSHYSIAADILRYQNLEPDRSVPADDTRCYLKFFKGKHVLLLAPFGQLLASRATKSTFEAVWSKIRKPWFEPASVRAIEFPYGYDRSTWDRFPTVIDLFDHIMQQVAAIEFDVALIAAGGLGIPLASQVKQMGRTAISLGGHLQVLFGVMGRRWRDRRSWNQNYFNDAWVPMSRHYRPAAAELLTDNGAYW